MKKWGETIRKNMRKAWHQVKNPEWVKYEKKLCHDRVITFPPRSLISRPRPTSGERHNLFSFVLSQIKFTTFLGKYYMHVCVFVCVCVCLFIYLLNFTFKRIYTKTWARTVVCRRKAIRKHIPKYTRTYLKK